MGTKSFGNLIRELRQKNKKYASLREFAGKVDLSPAYLSRIENDREYPPSPEVIEKLAEALGADKYELFSYAGKLPTEFLDTFKRNPKGVASFMRRAQEYGVESDDEWKELEARAAQLKKKK